MHFNLTEIWACFVLLFTITDMVGNIPIIISLNRKAMDQNEKSINALAVSLAVGIIFIGFLFLGKTILHWLSVDVQSFAVAGSIVIFFIALELILGIEIHQTGETSGNKIVPVAFPLIAGPGSLTLLLTLEADYATENIVIAILLNILQIYIFTKSANFLGRYLSDGVLSVIKKVFGVILLAISIRLFGDYAPLLFEH